MKKNSNRHWHVYSLQKKISTFRAQVTAVFLGFELSISLQPTNKNVANTITKTVMKKDNLQL